MSLHYLLDGYNLIHQMPKLILKSKLEDQRRAFVHYIEQKNLYGSAKNKVTVVFDGQSGMWGSQEGTPQIKVIFSCHECADARIKNIVTESAHKKNIVVVTNDREIKYFVRAEGAKVMSAEEFLFNKNPLRKACGSKKEEGKKISKIQEHAITTEMKKIWLKEN